MEALGLTGEEVQRRMRVNEARARRIRARAATARRAASAPFRTHEG
jgi:hypothetical protein